MTSTHIKSLLHSRDYRNTMTLKPNVVGFGDVCVVWRTIIRVTSMPLTQVSQWQNMFRLSQGLYMSCYTYQFDINRYFNAICFVGIQPSIQINCILFVKICATFRALNMLLPLLDVTKYTCGCHSSYKYLECKNNLIVLV